MDKMKGRLHSGPRIRIRGWNCTRNGWCLFLLTMIYMISFLYYFSTHPETTKPKKRNPLRHDWQGSWLASSLSLSHRDSRNHNTLKSSRDSDSREDPLQLFDPHRYPLWNSDGGHDRNNPIRIRVLLFEHHRRSIAFREGPTWAISDEVLNIAMDGFNRSPYFELLGATVVPDFTLQSDFVLPEDEQDIVWVVDMRRMMLNMEYTIPRQLFHLANATLTYQRDQLSWATFTNISVVLMDYRDRIHSSSVCSRSLLDLRRLLRETGGGDVYYVMQQVVRGRHWNDTLNFVSPGSVWKSRRDAGCFGTPILHIPYTVRSDYVEAIQREYPLLLPNSTGTDHSSPPDTIRPMDVAHLWSIRYPPEGHSTLRNHVSKVVQSLSDDTARTYKLITQFVSPTATVGRTRVASQYAEILLTTKIVVVAQRDSWEDHYRLFESIIGGALVMTDPMITLPHGLRDRESIVVYKSLDHLKELLMYYLNPRNEGERYRIARMGWEVAMNNHRSYHWMEVLFFGHPRSNS